MSTHAHQSKVTSIAAQIAQLPLLPMQNIWALWDEHFEDRPRHHHRTWLESRLAYKIQEKALGGSNPHHGANWKISERPESCLSASKAKPISCYQVRRSRAFTTM